MNSKDGNDKARIQGVIETYLRGINDDDVDSIPLSANSVMTGPMIPNTLEGEQPVRQHLADVAPFIARLKLVDLLIDGDRAVAVLHYEGINGVRLEGCEYFQVSDGEITQNRAFYDTAKLMRRA